MALSNELSDIFSEIPAFRLKSSRKPPTRHPNLEVFLSSVEEELLKDIKVLSFEIISLVKNGEQ